jgi:hypothetical protein
VPRPTIVGVGGPLVMPRASHIVGVHWERGPGSSQEQQHEDGEDRQRAISSPQQTWPGPREDVPLGSWPQSLWPANVVCETVCPHAFDSTTASVVTQLEPIVEHAKAREGVLAVCVRINTCANVDTMLC